MASTHTQMQSGWWNCTVALIVRAERRQVPGSLVAAATRWACSALKSSTGRSERLLPMDNSSWPSSPRPPLRTAPFPRESPRSAASPANESSRGARLNRSSARPDRAGADGLSRSQRFRSGVARPLQDLRPLPVSRRDQRRERRNRDAGQYAQRRRRHQLAHGRHQDRREAEAWSLRHQQGGLAEDWKAMKTVWRMLGDGFMRMFGEIGRRY